MMSAPLPTTIYVYIGTTKPDVVWRFLNGTQPFDGTGSTFLLTIQSTGQRFTKSTAIVNGGLTYDNTTGYLTWTRTIAESRQIALGSLGNYEIERRYGIDQEFVVAGAVWGLGGLNNDD